MTLPCLKSFVEEHIETRRPRPANESAPHVESEPETETDDVIVARAKNAANGAKFTNLWEGRWPLHYPSQSEGDFALIDMLAFYTKNDTQVVRLFRQSNQRDKAKRDNYVLPMLRKARDKQLPKIDLSGLTTNGKPVPIGVIEQQPTLSAGIRASELQHKHFEPVEWVVQGIVTQGLTIVGGRPKVGKSWLMLETAIAVAEGGYVLGKLCQSGDVLYAALEDTERRLKNRMWKLKGKSDWPTRLTFFCELQRGAEGIKQVRAWLEQADDPRAVFIDTFAKVRTPKRNGENSYDADYAAVGEWKALADEFNVAIVFVHHTRKQDAEDPFDTVSGTLGLTGAADAILILHSSNKGRTLLGRGRDVEEFALAVQFDAEACRWQALGNAADVQRSSPRNNIITLLSGSAEPMSPKDIAHSLNVADNSIRQLLLSMVIDGEVIKVDRGLYSIPTHNNNNKITETLL